jgi:beta-mannosidase
MGSPSVSEYFHPGVALRAGWEFLSAGTAGSGAAEAATSPADLAAEGWRPVTVPTTAAAGLREAGELTRSGGPDFDAQGGWYRVRVRRTDWSPSDTDGARQWLVFHGLATLATVFLNGEPLLETRNMFRRYAVDVTERLQDENELLLQFHALLPAMKAKKGPRRWPTRLVDHRNLRFFRTTLLGRMPGWTPPWPVVGPFRAVHLVTQNACWVEQLLCEPSLDDSGAKVRLRLRLTATAEEVIAVLHVGPHSCSVPLTRAAGGTEPQATHFASDVELRLPDVQHWWPHTHGAQPLYAARLTIQCGATHETFTLPQLGFRKIELLPAADFGFRINGVEVFCRGACWAPLDVVTLGASEGQLRQSLEQVKAAGMNMLRLSGTLAYELPAFHRLCDELGILVWQDFMFANMDYPRGDAEFDAEVEVEATELLERLAASCSTSLLCGGSETEQQAAMMGLPSDQWGHPLWREQLPSLVQALCPSVPYYYTTPGGAGLPFWPEDGCTHYYGVGAYMRPLSDARLTQVRFASECLAFANPPDEVWDEAAPPAEVRGRVPQDNGSSWDFGDVTEHYMGELFGVSPKQLLTEAPATYRSLAQRTTARVLYEAQTHFRDPATRCRGTLVWMLRDLEAGSGWGVTDWKGRAKSGYHALAQIWAPRAVWFVNEGLSGLTLVIANDPGEELVGEVCLQVCRETGQVLEERRMAVHIPPHGALRLRVEEFLGKFLDTTHSYRFGPTPFGYLQAEVTVEGQPERLTTTSVAPETLA